MSARTDHALTLNLIRRQLGQISWAKTFRKKAENRGLGDRLRGKGGRPADNAATVAALAEEAGVPARTARYRMQVADELEDEPDLAEQVDRGDMDVGKARRKKREREVVG